MTETITAIMISYKNAVVFHSRAEADEYLLQIKKPL